MKLHRLLIILVTLTTAVSARPAEKNTGAPNEQNEGAPEWAPLFGGAPLPVVWQSANAASDKIATTLAAKRLDGIADWAETIHLASHALLDQVKLDDPERSKRLKGALEQAAQIADHVLDAAQHNAPDKAADAYRRLKGALSVAKTRLPKDLVDAPPQEVRFAKAGTHAHDGHGGHVAK